MAKATPKKSRPKRRHIVPPPPLAPRWTCHLDLLKHVDPELAFVLWRALRRVNLWADTPADMRNGLFSSPPDEVLRAFGRMCVQAPRMMEPLGVLTTLVRAPHVVEPKRVAEACNQLQDWTDSLGLPELAMYFAEAAAAVDPANPRLANAAALACCGAEHADRAGSWYLRAYQLGVRAGDRVEPISALLGYATLLQDLGEFRKAREYFIRAARRAARTGRERLAAEIHHDLLTLVAEEIGDLPLAEWHARRALELYPLTDRRIPVIAHDWAFLLVAQRCYTPATPLLEIVARRAHSEVLQTLYWATLAGAAGGARRPGRFDELEAKLLLRLKPDEEFAPAALTYLADGARAFGRWKQAAEYAEQGVETARRLNQRYPERIMTALVEKIARKEPPPSEKVPPDADRIQRQAQKFRARMLGLKTPR